ncbi:CopG family transcriptional regulator [Candidatus Woesearchaeota archaeon]|nr:MAG: CopG family transcriptional regulator [Candidatus Woesearchaeota archaeon]
MAGKVSVSIPKSLAEKIEKRVKDSDFKDIDEYVAYVLEQVISKIESEDNPKEEAYSAEDEEKVKERLRSLGYLD